MSKHLGLQLVAVWARRMCLLSPQKWVGGDPGKALGGVNAGGDTVVRGRRPRQRKKDSDGAPTMLFKKWRVHEQCDIKGSSPVQATRLDMVRGGGAMVAGFEEEGGGMLR